MNGSQQKVPTKIGMQTCVCVCAYVGMCLCVCGRTVVSSEKTSWRWCCWRSRFGLLSWFIYFFKNACNTDPFRRWSIVPHYDLATAVLHSWDDVWKWDYFLCFAFFFRFIRQQDASRPCCSLTAGTTAAVFLFHYFKCALTDHMILIFILLFWMCCLYCG